MPKAAWATGPVKTDMQRIEDMQIICHDKCDTRNQYNGGVRNCLHRRLSSSMAKHLFGSLSLPLFNGTQADISVYIYIYIYNRVLGLA